MLTLCGFSASNYYNKVKLALLEKNLPFEEELIWLGQADLAHSALGKVPYLKTEHGTLSESDVIIEYVDTLSSSTPLLPSDAFAAAKVRELSTFLNLHLELVARHLYPQVLFGREISQEVRDNTLPLLEKNVAGLARLTQFSAFIAGDSFTLADCSAIVHLPLISTVSKALYGKDVLAELPVRDYLARMGERPSVQKVNADRKANAALLMERIKASAP